MPRYRLRHTDGATIWLDDGRLDLELAEPEPAKPKPRRRAARGPRSSPKAVPRPERAKEDGPA